MFCMPERKKSNTSLSFEMWAFDCPKAAITVQLLVVLPSMARLVSLSIPALAPKDTSVWSDSS